jgi:DEAD/DEAH box helicase domain-containing protein
MLHTAILPHHTKWSEFLANLRFVVIDEMHVYRGVFGSHVANLLRRLKRVASFYGSAPQFILTSATIANPAELAARLIEEPVTIIDDDGSPTGPKHFVIYNPPIVDSELGLRRSVLQESVRLTRELVRESVQTIVFGRARRTVELLVRYLREAGSDTFSHASFDAGPGANQSPTTRPNTGSRPGSITANDESVSSTSFAAGPQDLSTGAGLYADRAAGEADLAIRAYRRGYLPRQRREIESGLRDGRVRAVVATSALELGIDIGGMGAAVLAGYPGTIAATWQQAGRAGRQSDVALAMLITSANPLDQFLARQPSYFFERSPEQALINPDNLLILLQHLRCAAFELPFEIDDNFGNVDRELLAEYLQFLQESGELHRSGSKYFWMADQYPAEKVSLRSASPNTVQLLSGNDETGWATIGEVDEASAPWMVHPQAIYLHEGQSFIVDELDLAQSVARLEPALVNYYTEPRRETTVQLVEQCTEVPVRGGLKSQGDILVKTQVIGYRMVRWFSHERLGDGEVDLPPSELHTTGYWLTLTPQTVAGLRDQGLWTNDPNAYGPNWPAQRNRARARDAYRCQICGTTEENREHDVHHKVPFRRFAGYQQANVLSNLITLCRPCHRRAESAVRMRSGLAGLATALGHLAPLFLMCAQHDLGLHADPQSSLAEGQPAVVIYDMVPAGVGFSERLFDLHDLLVERSRDLVAGCKCRDGCPSCVGPAGEDGAGGKRETLGILTMLVEDSGKAKG